MELLPEQKSSHEEVGFEHPSRHGGQTCKECVHLRLIWIINLGPVHCETVKDPIKYGDYCKRWEDRG